MAAVKRAALYARVSHAGDQSPEQQLEALRTYATGRGWSIAGEYVDRAPASDLSNRTAWAQLRQDARSGRLDVVLVWKLDRAFRSALAALTAVQALERHRVAFVCATQPIDSSDPAGRLVFTILAAVAEMERSLISERTRAGLARARAEGSRIGRPKGQTDTRKRRRRRSRLELAATGTEGLPW